MSPDVRRRGSRPVLAVAGALAVISMALVLVPAVLGGEPTEPALRTVRLAADVIAAYVATVVLALVACRRHGIERVSWALMAIGTAGWGTGSLIWATYLAVGQPLPAPSPADAFYMLLPVSWAVALVVRTDRTDPVERATTIIDSAIVAIALLMVTWVVAVRVTGVADTEAATLMTLAYPVADSVVVCLLLRTISRGSPDRRALVLLTAGMVSYTVGDAAFLVVSYLLEISPAVPTFGNTFWVVGFSVIAGGAWVALGGREGPVRRSPRLRPGLVPLVIAGSAATLALVDLTRADGGSWTVLSLVVVMMLLLARQSLTLNQNRRLSTDLVASVRGLEHQASHDALTGLPNREHLTSRLRELIATDRSDRPSAVMFLDIDLLKPINDSLGHRHGDRLICVVAERLQARWGDDVVRFGGDEFVVLLRRCPTVADVVRQAERLVADMRQPFTTQAVSLQPSVSVGVVVLGDGADPAELLRRADVALYHAKAQGRHRAAMFDPSMDDGSRRRIAIAPQLRVAVERDEFELHYQPIVDVETGRITTVEALIRWRHPDEGLLTPDRFLAEADALGLLGEIGRRSLFEATARFARVNARRTQDPIRVSVNLSASELGPAALANVDEALAASRLDPSLLVLEITEDVIVDDAVRRTLGELHELGVVIAIDDFGTGNSSLRQLGEYAASVLKVDRSFIDGIGDPDDAHDTDIVHTVVDLAARLGLATVAEGVETPEQAEQLRALGCRHVQGWLVDRAVPFDVLEERWLAGDRSTERALAALGRAEPAPSAEPGPSGEVVQAPQSRRSDSSAPSMIRSSSSATVGSSSITPTT